MLIFKPTQGQEPYANIWSVNNKDNYALVQFSTYEKWTDKNGNQSTRYSNWLGKFVGHAFNAIKSYSLDKGDTIKIKSIKFECQSSKGDNGQWDNKYYTTIFDFEKVDRNNDDDDYDDDDMPL